MRFLSPDVFGDFTLLAIIFLFIKIIRDLGISDFIIQKQDLTSSYFSTSFWLNFAATLLLCLSLIAVKKLLPINFNNYTSNLFGLFTLELFLSSFNIVPLSLLKKDQNFKSIFKLNFVASIVSSSLSIALCFGVYANYAIIIKLIIWTLIISLGVFYYSRLKVKFSFKSECIKEIFNFGLPLTGSQLLSFIGRNIDDYFIGLVLGNNKLGIYNRSYNLMMLPMNGITNVMSTVLFSTWSTIKDNLEQISAMYISTTKYIAFIAFPIMTFMSAYSSSIVLVLFGEKWIEMSNILAVLSIVGMFQSVGSLLGTLFVTFDKNYVFFKWNLISNFLTSTIIIISIYYYRDLEIIAIIYASISFIYLIPTFGFVSKLLKTRVADLIQPLIRPLFTSALSIIVCLIISTLYSNFSLITSCLLSASLFFTLYICLNLKPFVTLFSILKKITKSA